MGKYAIEVENVGMKFNMSSEKVDDLKDYVIKLLKRQLQGVLGTQGYFF